MLICQEDGVRGGRLWRNRMPSWQSTTEATETGVDKLVHLSHHRHHLRSHHHPHHLQHHHHHHLLPIINLKINVT